MLTQSFSDSARRWLCVAALLVSARSGLAESYSVRDLGPLTDLAGRNVSMPYAINHQGKVAGVNVTNGAYRALLFGGAWTNLGTLGGGESFAAGLNDLLRVVGYSLVAGGATHAFLWTPGGTNGVASNRQMRDLGTLGGANSEAYDINNSGQITGYAQTPDDEHAFRYSGGVMTDIGALLDSSLPHSFGYSINEAGHVAGTAYSKNYRVPHAFYFNGTTAVDLGNLGGQGSSAMAINNRGQIVGYVSTSAGVDHAFRYAGGVMTDLGTLGGNWSYAVSINNSNVIVGGSFVDPADTVYHAFLCVSNVMRDLNGLLDASGAGWTLVEARSINDSGQVVGVGRRGGVNRGFLLNPVPCLTKLKRGGTNMLISFTSVNAAPYTVESRDDVAKGGWSNAVPGLIGNGGILTATNYGAATRPKRLYRVKLLVP